MDGTDDVSDTAGEVLRVEPAAEADEESCRALLWWEKGTAKESRDLESWCLSLEIAASGSCASEAERCGGGSRVIGEPAVASSITLARPGETNDTLTAMSQLRPLSKRDTLILRASKHSLSSKTTTSASWSKEHSEPEQQSSPGDRSSSDDR